MVHLSAVFERLGPWYIGCDTARKTVHYSKVLEVFAMQFRKVVSAVFSTLAAMAFIGGTTNGAYASQQVSGVAIPGPSTKGSSVFVSKEPALNTYNSYLINCLNLGKYGAGVNIPTLYSGDVTNLGYFSFSYIYYEVPNNGAPVNSGFSVVIQTDDGFSRIATNPASTFFQNSNNYNVYFLFMPTTAFSPSFNAHQTVLKTESVRYNGSAGPLYMFYPVVIGDNGSLYNEFSFKTNPDARFNNQ